MHCARALPRHFLSPPPTPHPHALPPLSPPFFFPRSGSKRVLAVCVMAREEGMVALTLEIVTEGASFSIPVSCRVGSA